jgi:hypothetical protein
VSTPEDPYRTGPPPQQPARDAPPTWDSAGSAPQGYGPPPLTYGQTPGYGGGQTTSTKAIIALVLAIGSFAVFPLVPAIIALVLASGARDEIDASGGRVGGDGLVTAAKVVAWINIGLCVAGVLALVAVFGLFAVVGFS